MKITDRKIYIKIYRLLFLVGLYLIANQSVCASIGDSTLNGLRIEGKMLYGFIYPHSSFIEYVLDRNIHGAEFLVSTGSTGRHSYEYLYRYPRYGAGYNFTNFGNAEVLGKAHALFGFCEVPFYRSNNRLNVNYKIDFGLAYNTVVYDVYENPLDHSISSKFNGFVGFDFNATYSLSNRNHIKLGFELTHYSNGKAKSPNLGINAVTLTAAYLYDLKPFKPLAENLVAKPLYDKHVVDIVWNNGYKRDDMLNEKLYHISTLVADYYYCFAPKYGFGGGVDFFYDASLAPTKEFEEKVEANSSDNYQFGAHLGAMARYNNFGVLLETGHYIHAPFHKYSAFYSRFGMRYAIKGRVILNFTIKAHYAIADYIEWGIGYRF